MIRMSVLPAWLAATVMASASFGPMRAAQATVIPYSGAVVQYAITQTGMYGITVVGASGGTTDGSVGGSGARVSGEIELLANTFLYFVVGGAGGNGGATSPAGGGGGGTFVFLDTLHALLVAGGGGGGGSNFSFTNGGDAQVATAGQNGLGPQGGAGGTAGFGGAGGAFSVENGGGGAGFLSDGTAQLGPDGQGGSHSTFAGGRGDNGVSGGFGGGGGAGVVGGGGGGGYSGGGGGDGNVNGPGYAGGGGGSFAADEVASPLFTSGFNASGNGFIDISLIPAAVTPTAVPEPASMALLFTGLGLLLFQSRRRRPATRPAADKAAPEDVAFSRC